MTGSLTVPAASCGGHRRAVLALAGVIVSCGSLLGAAGCSVGGSDPSVPYSLAGLNASTISSTPGQETSVGIPISIHTGRITLESAAMLPLSGYPTPQFTGAGLVRSKGWDVITHGWPPQDQTKSNDPSKAATIKVKSLAGTVISADQHVVIYYSFSGSREGQVYYAAGIKLTYRDSSGEHAAALYQVGVECVVSKALAATQNCQMSPAANKAIAALALDDRMSGHGRPARLR